MSLIMVCVCSVLISARTNHKLPKQHNDGLINILMVTDKKIALRGIMSLLVSLFTHSSYS